MHAVDLLDSAVEQLRTLAPTDGSTTLHVQQADLVEMTFTQSADLVFAFSAVEHLPGTAAIGSLFERIRAALAPGGIVALGIVADRFEIDAAGDRRPALLESELSTQDVDALVAGAFSELETVSHGIRPLESKSSATARPTRSPPPWSRGSGGGSALRIECWS